MRYEEITDRISAWLAERLAESNTGGFLVGLSGGLDSSVVLGLAVRAAPGKASGVIMPCESRPEDEEHAGLAALAFGAETIRLPLDNACRAMLDVMPESGDALVRANLKARLRMAALYFLANSRRRLVLGTGNRSELAVGYFTKYGDGGADLLPIGGLLKTQVIELAGVLGVPEEIIKKPPSAGLWPGQTDEKEMGVDYGTLDMIIEALDSGREPQAPKEIVTHVRKMICGASHKLKMPPVFNISE